MSTNRGVVYVEPGKVEGSRHRLPETYQPEGPDRQSRGDSESP